MEVKLETMKLSDGVTVLEAEMFEAGNEVFVVTEDEQKIALPIGEYELEDGRILIVVEEGVISEIKEKEAEEEEAPEEAPIEEEAKKEQEMETSKAAPKKIVESMIKESFFSEIEALKNENNALKAELSKLKEAKEVELSEVKPISFNPENENTNESIKLSAKRQRTTMDSILEKLNK
jgi:tRNA A37 N6-isopentenylltransferase MiaA